MKRSYFAFLTCVLGIVAAMGCQRSTEQATVAESATQFHLAEEPAGAIEVLDAKETAQDGEPIVLVGRIGREVDPWVDGLAAFLLVDTRVLPSCADGSQCSEGCADCASEMTAASTMIKFVDSEGKVLPVDARKLLRVKDDQTVVVQGVAKRDSAGNVSVAASRIFVR